jgi:hypothetical protein
VNTDSAKAYNRLEAERQQRLEAAGLDNQRRQEERRRLAAWLEIATEAQLRAGAKAAVQQAELKGRSYQRAHAA